MSAVLAPAPTAAMHLGDTPGLTRNEEEHVYRFKGNVVPGITRLMEPIHSYDGVPEWILERKAALGSDVHYATELYDLGTLDEGSLAPVYVPYVEAWKKFRREHCGRIHAIEPKLYHAGHGYAGQPDRCMQIDTDYDVLEIKTTAHLFNAVGVQLMAQRHLLAQSLPAVTTGKRIAIQLKADGTYRLREYKDPHDWPTFIALLSIANWQLRYGNH